MTKFRAIVAGSRGFRNYSLLTSTLINYFAPKGIPPEDVEIISGTAEGADTLGEKFATRAGCKLTKMPADWDKHGKSAGFIRNWDMAKYASSDESIKGICFLFWDGDSKGTMHMKNLAEKEGLETHVINYKEIRTMPY